MQVDLLYGCDRLDREELYEHDVLPLTFAKEKDNVSHLHALTTRSSSPSRLAALFHSLDSQAPAYNLCYRVVECTHHYRDDGRVAKHWITR